MRLCNYYKTTDNDLDYSYPMTDNFSFDLDEDVFRISSKVWRYFKYTYHMFDI